MPPLLIAAVAMALAGPTGAAPAAVQLAQEAPAQALPVRVDPVARVPLSQTVPVIGRLIARRLGAVAARVNAPVKAFRVAVGDRVKTGQIVAELDTATLRAQRDVVAGRLHEARAVLAVKQAQLALAEQDFKRMEGLKTSAAFSQARYDDANQRVVIGRAQAGEARSAIAGARADLELADINLRNATVRAPYPGVVTERLTEAGAYVQTGDPILRMIGDLDLEVEADVPFQNLSGLEPGTEVPMMLDDGTRHTAVVRAIVPSENPLTRTRAVRFVPNIGRIVEPLAHRQSVSLDIPIGPERTVLSVHKDAIIKRRGQDLVFVVIDGAVEARPVDLGTAVGSRFEVRAGLRAGEAAVVRGNERLKPGDKVLMTGPSS
ncbi:MAG: efflux RND transporter periplasmic adaptor subunit [Kiloniellaceae bacterium]